MWIETIVMPREESKTPWRPSSQRDRRAIYQAGLAESQQFRDSLLHYLQSQKLMGSVKWVSEPGCLPMVTLHCQERVLKQLRKAPQFEAGRSAGLALHS